MAYLFWLCVFRISLRAESMAIWSRDIAQRKKLEAVKLSDQSLYGW